jgi:hypothetical protein
MSDDNFGLCCSPFGLPPGFEHWRVEKVYSSIYNGKSENQLYVLHARYNFLSTKNEMILNAKLYFEG